MFPDRSIEPRETEPASFGFAADVELVAVDTLPVSVWVEVDHGELCVTMETETAAYGFRRGTSLGQADIQPEDWARLCERAGVQL